MLLAQVCVWVVLRLSALNASPPGFFVDESAGATHLVCISEERSSSLGQRWPLYAPHFEGSKHAGVVSPLYLYLGGAWTRAFGHSIGSLRLLTALFGLAAAGLLFVLGSRIGGHEAGLWAALAGLISPWSFQLSRIAWDSSLAPALLLGAMVAVVRSRSTASRVTAGLLFAATVYTYPPAAATVPILFAGALGWRLHREGRVPRADVVVAIVFVVGMLPWGIYRLADDRPDRFAHIGVGHAKYLKHFHQPSVVAYPLSFGHKMLRHLDPRFLFVSGDRNLRHSPPGFGQWSWLDAYAVGLGLLLLAGALVQRSPPLADTTEVRGMRLALGASAFGYLAAIVPAALTWSGLPNALRSSLCWPFLALATGILLTQSARRWPRIRWPHLGVACAFGAVFATAYFHDYPAQARRAFGADEVDAVRAHAGSREAVEAWVAEHRSRPAGVLRYYLIAFGGHGCASSAAVLDALEPEEAP